jgi:D-alanine-D-alanine ligase
MKKPIVAVVFGSRSTEHDISVLTAIASVIKPLEISGKYHVLPVYIAKDGRWYAGSAFKQISFFQAKDFAQQLQKLKPVALQIGQGLKVVGGQRFGQAVTPIDIVFPALHGTHGEDGEVMALCELAGVPYVGCDVPASVVAMDKVLAKQTALAAGIPTPAFVSFSKYAYEAEPEAWLARIAKTLRYPLFVKPAHLGSSIGITRVTNAKDLANAIEVALHYDTKALVEEGVENLIEVTLPVMGNETPRPALLEQPTTKGEDFFDFDTKYMQQGTGKGKSKMGGAKQGAQGYSQIPAPLPEKLYARAEAMGLAVFQALGCQGMARVDMLIDGKTGQVFFNEVNPLPGSLYAHNWRLAGVSNVQLVEQLLTLAMERFAHKERTATSFTTSFLQQF